MKIKANHLIVVILSLMVFVFWGNTLWIQIKAKVAQHLIANAWATTLLDQEHHKPWAWADTWPIAKLRLPKNNLQHYVLEGSNGNALAFSPGHITESAYPGEQGTIIISGHRDTHFNFLKNIQHGDIIELDNYLGQTQSYTVTQLEITDIRETKLDIYDEQDELKLVTCYPFDAIIPGGPLRMVVTAEETQEREPS